MHSFLKYLLFITLTMFLTNFILRNTFSVDFFKTVVIPTCLAYKHVLLIANNNVKQLSTFQSSKLKETPILETQPTNIKKMVSSCIFCKICEKSAPADILYEDSEMIIFKDIKPAVKHHYLAVSKEHIPSAKHLLPEQKYLLEKFVQVSKELLQRNGGDINDVTMGFHWPPFNSVSHLHMHVISPSSDMGFISRQVFRPGTWWFVSVDYVLEKLTNKL